jgi:N-acetylglucosaminyl-diphospho-decaprenol L-rhamnosyltransferase
MTFDIVIVTFNNREDLDACLASLVEARPAGLARIIVVDNASSDGTVEHVRKRWPDVELIASRQNLGFGAANNIGIRQASAPLVLLLNNDTIVPARALEMLAARLVQTGAVAAGPRLVDAQGHPEVSFGSMLSPASEAVQLVRGRLAASRSRLARRYIANLVGRERFVDWVSGGCLLVRREAAVAAGLFDERYFLYEEDVDFCAALRAAGGRILFTPAASIVHLRGRSVARSGAKPTAHYDRSHLAFYEKHRPAWVPLLRLWLRLRGRSVR